MNPASKFSRQWRLSAPAAFLCFALAAGPPAQAQMSEATLRGHITLGQAAAVEGVKVVATNVDNGFATRTTTRADGSYVLSGLAPGGYRIEVSAEGYDQQTEAVTLFVGQTADLDIAVTDTAAALDQVIISGAALRETRTSELGTSVTLKQMQALPQVTRNFLSFADLSPGVSFTTASDGTTKLQGGAQSGNSVNVYVDGVGQKNYVLTGGVTGQDSSRGNPFPQSAIREYKVITQNYKAEFDQVSSAAIVAVSQSGTNEFHGDTFWDHTGTGWRTPTPAEQASGKKATSFQNQFGVSLGGPIVTDVAHFFFAYEGKRNLDPKTIALANTSGLVVPAALENQIGGTNAPFNEDLIFGKVDWAINGAQRVEFTAKVRRENELTNVGGQNAVAYATTKKNDETRLDLKHQYVADDWINELHVAFERAYYNPTPSTNGPGATYENAGNGTVLNVGGGRDYQKKGQYGPSLQDDFTFTNLHWQGAHVAKFGVKIKRVTLDAQEISPYNPQYFYDLSYSATVPYKMQFGAPLNGVGNGTSVGKNTQFGIYGQDDWELNRHLTINAGVRWDYEETPTYLNYVTPPDVVAALRGWASINNPSSGININDYISTGSNRSANKGEIQPRLGFSFDLLENQQHVVYGGYGRSYDRNIFDYLQLEQTKATFPSYQLNFPGDPSANHGCTLGPTCVTWDPSLFYTAGTGLAPGLAPYINSNGAGREIDLINNNLKVPYADQLSLGIRDTVGIWNTDVAISHIASHDGFAFLLGNRLPGGVFFAPNLTGSQGLPWNYGVPGFGNLILGTSGLSTTTNALLVKVDKPYTTQSGWGVTLAYTFSDAKENRQFDQHYALDFPNLSGYGMLASSGVSKSRLVASNIDDLPYGMVFSAKLTLASGAPIYESDCSQNNAPCRITQIQPQREGFLFGKLWAYRQIDVALNKEFQVGWHQTKLRLRGDILNLANTKNYASSAFNADGSLNGQGDLAGPTRTFKLSAGASF
jgi:outer membrane receptor protein involved in Fe transport